MTTEKTDGAEVSVLENVTADSLVILDTKLKKYGWETTLENIKTKVMAMAGTDVSTEKARKDIISAAFKVSQSKVFLEKMLKKREAELKEAIKPYENGRKNLVTFLDALRDDVRRPVTEWETEDKRRTDILKNSLNAIRDARFVQPAATSSDIAALIEEVKKSATLNFAEFKEEADQIREQTLGFLTTALSDRKELEELRKKAAETPPPAEPAAQPKPTDGQGSFSDEKPAATHTLDMAQTQAQLHRVVMMQLSIKER